MTTLHTSPHTLLSNSVTRMMLLVIAAMIPALLVYIWFFGWGIVINAIICIVTAYVTETWMLKLRKRPLAPFLTDGSALLTALLIAFALPPLLPWWIGVLATAFAIIIAKHLYGGLGYNPFNPAMLGYATSLIVFPKQLTAWIPAASENGFILSFSENLRFNLFGEIPQDKTYDLITQASPLDTIDIQVGLGKTVSEIENSFTQFSHLFGVGWDWISLMFLLGGLFLIYKRVITWHIPAAMLGTIAVFASIAWLANNETNPDPLFHVLGGASMIGAFFIATDPVTASTTPRGKLIYGVGIGAITYFIRAWGGYPDGVAFGVLIMNMAVPTIDYYTQPRVYGHGKDID